MMRLNNKLLRTLSGNGVLSSIGVLAFKGNYKRAAKKFADRVELSGELLLYNHPSGSGKKVEGSGGRSGRKVNLSMTDAEIAHNEVRVCDLLGCADKYRPARAAALFFACAGELDKKLDGTPFELVLYIGGESAGAFRLCRVRVNDPSWLSENIDSYAEPVAVYRNYTI